MNRMTYIEEGDMNLDNEGKPNLVQLGTNRTGEGTCDKPWVLKT